MMRALAILCAALSALASASVSAEELGRLVLTPEQREALDARRRARLPDKPAAAASASPTTRVDGYVQRSGGRSTVWVNGQSIAEDATDASARIARGAPGVSLRLGEDGRDVRTQVGQSIDTLTGDVKDPLGDGQVRVKRPAPPRDARPK